MNVFLVICCLLIAVSTAIKTEFTLKLNGGGSEKALAIYDNETQEIVINQMNFEFIQNLLPNAKLFNSYGNVITAGNDEIKSDDTLYLGSRPGEWFVWSNDDDETIKILVDVHEDNRKLSLKTLMTTNGSNNSPHVFQIDNFLSDKECDELIRLATEKGLSRSFTRRKNGDGGVDKGRTSDQTWLDQNEYKIAKVITERANRLMRIDNIGLHEQIQIARYLPSNHYGAHLDSWPQTLDQGEQNRFTTFLIYLNNVDEGGETAFPLAGRRTTDEYPIHTCANVTLKVTPKKGRAVLFYNLDSTLHMTGVRDPFSRHTGCPVVKGEKWICNLWTWNKWSNWENYERFTGIPHPNENFIK